MPKTFKLLAKHRLGHHDAFLHSRGSTRELQEQCVVRQRLLCRLISRNRLRQISLEFLPEALFMTLKPFDGQCAYREGQSRREVRSQLWQRDQSRSG